MRPTILLIPVLAITPLAVSPRGFDKWTDETTPRTERPVRFHCYETKPGDALWPSFTLRD